MNAQEAVYVLRKVRAYRPAMIIDDLSGEAWLDALHDIRYADANQAVSDLGKRTSDWIDPAMVRNEALRIRERRIKAHGQPIPPYFDNYADELAWTRDAIRRIGDGETVPGRGIYRPELEDSVKAQRSRRGAETASLADVLQNASQTLRQPKDAV